MLALLALKLASVRRYSADDEWCMDRGLGLFAGLNVLPEAAWFSAYSQPVNPRLLAAMVRALSERGLTSETANLDFTPILHWSADATLKKHGSGQRGRRLVGLSVALAQGPDAGLLPCADAATRSDTASAAVLEFLDEAGVLFVTVRRRGQRIVAVGADIAAADRREVRVPLARGTRLVQAHDGRVKLRPYGGELRQVTVFRGSRRRPTMLLTNDFDSSLSHILRRCQALDCRVVHRRATRLIPPQPALHLDGDQGRIRPRRHCRRLSPVPTACLRSAARLQTLQAQDPVRILWLGNRRIQFQGATRS